MYDVEKFSSYTFYNMSNNSHTLFTDVFAYRAHQP